MSVDIQEGTTLWYKYLGYRVDISWMKAAACKKGWLVQISERGLFQASSKMVIETDVCGKPL